MRPSLDIVIVNWNSGEQLINCLASLKEISSDSFILSQVIVVDNNSNDGSAELERLEDIPVTVLKNNKNRGFGAACNQGAGCGVGEYILFLNPDTIATAESIVKAVKWMEGEEASSTGVCGIKLVDKNGVIGKGCTRIPKPSMLYSYTLGLDRISPRMFPSHFMQEWSHESSREVDHVIGAFYLVRRTLFNQLQGFDERFFVYMEDLDFSCRVKQSGYAIYYFAETQVFHEGGGTSRQIKGLRLFYSLRSKLLYAEKHFTKRAYYFLIFLTLIPEFTIRIGLSLSHLSFQEISAVLEAYKLIWKEFLFSKKYPNF